MLGIFPGIANGGVVVRDIDGNCVGIDVPENAYCPPEAFTTTCAVTFLPDNCTGRITPSQINAIVSEMLCLAQTFDTDGEWDCESTCNLSTLFQQWVADHTPQTDGITIDGDGSPGDKIRLIPLGAVGAICDDEDAKAALALCLTSGDAANLIRPGTDGGMWAGLFLSSNFSGDGTQADPLTLNVDNVIFTICEDPEASLDFANCMIAAIGGDVAARATLAGIVQQGICATDAVADALSLCLVSTDPNNSLSVGSDGRLFGGGGGLPAGTSIEYFGASPPVGFYDEDGSAVSRTTNATLFARLWGDYGFVPVTFTVTIASPGVFTKAAHGFTGGERIRLSTTGALPTGLNTTTDYFVIFVDANTFRLATTQANYEAGTAINTSGAQNGVHSYLQSLFGLGDGATTFNLPDSRNTFSRTNPASGRTLGSQRGSQNLAHNHTITDPGHVHTISQVYTTPSGTFARGAGTSFKNDTILSTDSATTGITINSNGGTEAYPRHMTRKRAIKY